jgi:hypothetical protein
MVKRVKSNSIKVLCRTPMYQKYSIIIFWGVRIHPYHPGGLFLCLSTRYVGEILGEIGEKGVFHPGDWLR